MESSLATTSLRFHGKDQEIAILSSRLQAKIAAWVNFAAIEYKLSSISRSLDQDLSNSDNSGT